MPIDVNAINPDQPANPAAVTPYVSYGTLSINDLLRVNNKSIIDFGRFAVFQAIQQFFAAYNLLVNDQLNLLCQRTTVRVRGVGGPVAKTAMMVDEYGVAPPQKAGGVGQLGFPLRAHQVNQQWTALWMQEHTPAEMAREVQTAAIADLKMLQYWLKVALFNPTNYVFTDVRVDYMSLWVKALANADGFPIPPSPNGALFNPSTHTHYSGTTNSFPSNADLGTLQRNVAEHFVSGQMYLYVTEDFGDVLITGAGGTYADFVKLTYEDQVYSIQLTLGRGTLQPVNQANRQIGVFRGAQVWVKPWVPQNVTLCYISGADTKPLVMRVPMSLATNNGDFRPIWNDVEYPTQCELNQREYGFGVGERTSAAVLSYAGGDTNYHAPTITP
jgi:hypothetical protein